MLRSIVSYVQKEREVLQEADLELVRFLFELEEEERQKRFVHLLLRCLFEDSSGRICVLRPNSRKYEVVYNITITQYYLFIKIKNIIYAITKMNRGLCRVLNYIFTPTDSITH